MKKGVVFNLPLYFCKMALFEKNMILKQPDNKYLNVIMVLLGILKNN